MVSVGVCLDIASWAATAAATATAACQCYYSAVVCGVITDSDVAFVSNLYAIVCSLLIVEQGDSCHNDEAYPPGLAVAGTSHRGFGV